MKVVVQRVSQGGVEIPEENYNLKIGKGLVVLFGVTHSDTENDLIFLADKIVSLRIFEDDNGKMNLSLKDIDGEILIISQFTLYGDAIKGNRPGFTEAAAPDFARSMYEKFVERIKNNFNSEKVKTGIFGAMMKVEIINEGPVTIIIDSKMKFKKD